ncbi:WGR domain-containing protein [Roseibium salinum]|nr:WGR domain-containing protein [Roseibium salinum]
MENRDEIILLTRVDRARNMARFYRLAIEPTLFGGLVLHRTWGRLGTWGGNRAWSIVRTSTRPMNTGRV